jgi:methionyl-tRNA synthetase
LEPWAVKKSNPNRMNTILFTITQQIKNISILLSPIIPDSSKKIINIMNINDEEIKLKNILKFDLFNHNKELKNVEILFKKIENDN